MRRIVTGAMIVALLFGNLCCTQPARVEIAEDHPQTLTKRTIKSRIKSLTGGVWTALSIEGMPTQPNKLPVVYQDGDMTSLANLKARVEPYVKADLPIVLNIEHHPWKNGPKDYWWLDRDLVDVTNFNESESYMVSRLAAVQKLGGVVGLWDRPTGYQMTHVWKPKTPAELKAKYQSRWDQAAAVLEHQDFVCPELYLPVDHQPHAAKGWPADELISRGDYFVDKAAEFGKPAMVFLSPTYGGVPGADYVPAGWLTRWVEHFTKRGVAVCLWGGHGKKWDDADPVCKELAVLMGTTLNKRE